MKPFAISIVGRKNSGRSEVLTYLISHLKQSRLRIGVIKHLAREDFEIDEPGKDTFEYRVKGAEKVMLSGKKRLALFANLEDEIPLSKLLEQFGDYDLVFLEGYFSDELSKIEVHRNKAGVSLAGGLSNVIAICSDEKEVLQKEFAIPCFSFEELLSLAVWIENRLIALRGEVHV